MINPGAREGRGKIRNAREPGRKRDKKTERRRACRGRDARKEGGRAMSDGLSIDHLDYWDGIIAWG